MKSNIITVSVAITLGLCIGWQLKSSDKSDANAGNSPELESRNHSDRTSKLSRPTSLIEEQQGNTKSSRPASESLLQNIQKFDKDKFAQMARPLASQQNEMRDEKIITDLVKLLKLNSSQEQKIREYLAKVRADIDLAISENRLGDVAKLEPEGHLDWFLETMLTEEQKTLYAKDKEESRIRKTESKALTQLARMSEIVKLRDDQKDAAYQALYNQEHQDPELELEHLPLEIPTNLLKSMLGGADKNGDTITMVSSPLTPKDTQDILNFQKERQNRIERQVNAMSAVLDEEQLKLYRDHLEGM